MLFWTRQKAVGTSSSGCIPFNSSLQPGEFLHWHLWPDSKFLYCSKTAKQLGQGAKSLSEFILLKLEVWSCLANKISLHHSPCSYALQRVLWTRWWKAIKRTQRLLRFLHTEIFAPSTQVFNQKLIKEEQEKEEMYISLILILFACGEGNFLYKRG